LSRKNAPTIQIVEAEDFSDSREAGEKKDGAFRRSPQRCSAWAGNGCYKGFFKIMSRNQEILIFRVIRINIKGFL
jgi:hypothetical protein